MRKIFVFGCVVVLYISAAFLLNATFPQSAFLEIHWGGYMNLVSRPAAIETEKAKTQCGLNWKTTAIELDNYETSTPFKLSKAVRRRKHKVATARLNPIYRLDEERFLMPILNGGANNQLIGLWMTAFYAIKLNRTLVLPKFKKHRTDRQKTSSSLTLISPNHRIDIEDLCSFVTCVTVEDFFDVCQETETRAVYFLRCLTKDIVRSMKQILELPAKLSDFLPFHTRSPVDCNKRKKDIGYTPGDIQVLLNYTTKCMISILPYGLHGRDGITPKKASHFVLHNEIPPSVDAELMNSVMRHCHRPKYIQEMANDFISSVLAPQHFIAVHWRYNEGDFLKREDCDDGSKQAAKLCNEALNFTTKKFAQQIEKSISSLSKNGINVQKIYIAAPPSERQRIENLAEFILLKQEWKTYFGVHLEEFVRNRYGNCNFIFKHFDDIISSTEMEICTRAVTFLGTVYSTWTGNVQISRIFSDDPQIQKKRSFIIQKETTTT